MDTTRKITLRILDESGQKQLRDALIRLEKSINKKALADALYSLLTELISNAVRANLKRAFFVKNKYSLNDPESYHKGLEEFKLYYKRINEKSREYHQSLEDLQLTISINIELDSDCLLIHIENNTILLEQEEKRIRQKLAYAMQSKNLIQYSNLLGGQDETEGKGFGLAMIVLLIKHLGFDPNNFRVYTRDSRTIARLELPLSSDYIPIRDRKAESS